MALVEGPSLKDRLQEQPLAAEEAARLTRTVAEAVEYAHCRGVVHRDLKPSNILLDASGSPKITDFGLAKQLSDDTGLTVTGQIMGTPSYMPPEQASGRMDEVGPRSDVYALGALLYALVSGRPPFNAPTVMETILQLLHEEPAPLRRLNATIPIDLETIVHRCLQKDPARRYATAQELADDLGRFLRGEPVVARPVGGITRAWRWCRRNPATAALVASVAALLMATAAVSSYAYVREARLAEDKSRLLVEKEGLLTQTKSLARKERTERGKAEVLATQEQLARKEAVHELYLAQIARAAAELQGGNVAAANAALAAAPYEHRNWEHGYLSRVAEGTPLTLRDPAGPINALAYSPDGSLLATLARNGTLRFRSVDTGAEVRTILHPAEYAGALAFSPDGTMIATSANKEVKLWRIADGTEVRTFDGPTRDVYSLDFTPDGAKLVSVGSDHNVVVWNVADGTILHTLKGHTDTVYGVACSPDGARAVSGGYDNTARIWDLATGAEVLKLPLAQPCRDVAYSPDGKVIAVAAGNFVTLYDAVTGRSGRSLVQTENGYATLTNKILWSMAFSPDGRHIAAGNLGGHITVWSLSDIRVVYNLAGHASSPSALDFSPDTFRLASGGDQVKVWDFAGSAYERRFFVFGTGFADFHLSADSRQIATAHHNGMAKIWDVRSGVPLRTFAGHDNGVSAVSFNADGSRLATGARDKRVRVWDIATGNKVRSYDSSADSAFFILAYSPREDRLAAQHDAIARTVWIYDTATNDPAIALKHADFVFNFRWSPRGDHVATACRDGKVRIWTAKGELLQDIATGTEGAYDVEFDPTGQRIAVCGARIRVCEWKTKRDVLTVADPNGHTSRIAYSVDGKRLATATADAGFVNVWDVPSGKHVMTLRGNSARIAKMEFARDGKSLVVLDNHEVVVRDSRVTQETVAMLHHPVEVEKVWLSKAGSRAVTRDGANSIRVWDQWEAAGGEPAGKLGRSESCAARGWPGNAHRSHRPSAYSSPLQRIRSLGRRRAPQARLTLLWQEEFVAGKENLVRPPGFAIGYHLRRMLAASDEQLRAAGLERGALEARLKNAEEKLRQAL